MNRSKFLGVFLCGMLISVSTEALELQELWHVSLPKGQYYKRAGIAWSPSDSLPHLFILGREDQTVYHMIPGEEFEPVLILPDYPLGGIECFGVCLDSTLGSSVLVHFRYFSPDTGLVTFVNLLTGDSLYGTEVTTHYDHSYWWDELEYWWSPNTLFCSGSTNGMLACLYGPYHEDGYYCDIFGHCETWSANRGHSKTWSVSDLPESESGGLVGVQTQAFCLMGSDSVLDWAYSGRYWGWSESEQGGHINWNWPLTSIRFYHEADHSMVMADQVGTLMALERADGPAWGLLFFTDDSVSYWLRGPTQVWTIPLNISSPTLAAVFPQGILPQRIALVYSSSGTLTEIDLMYQHAAETVDFPMGVRALHPYLADDGSWELMAVFDRDARGYRVTGLLPADERAGPALPETYSIHAYPNPFNDAVKITYELPRSGTVSLRIVDILGREVKTLVREPKAPGKHEVIWKADRVSSGIYFVCFETGGATRVQKLVHLK